jgi:hypothetical protein
MTEEEARFELLKIELQGVHSSIQNMDTIVFQIKGWCITAALAIGGFAVSSHVPALTLIGIAAVIGFFFINCQFKAIQRAFIKRSSALDSELKTVGIMQVIGGAGSLEIVGTAIPQLSPTTSYSGRIRFVLSGIWHEARLMNTFSLYLFLFILLIAEAIVLFV